MNQWDPCSVESPVDWEQSKMSSVELCKCLSIVNKDAGKVCIAGPMAKRQG